VCAQASPQSHLDSQQSLTPKPPKPTLHDLLQAGAVKAGNQVGKDQVARAKQAVGFEKVIQMIYQMGGLRGGHYRFRESIIAIPIEVMVARVIRLQANLE
jgi:hypothetical protein